MDKKTFDALFERSFATAVKHDYAADLLERADSVSLSWEFVRKQMETIESIDGHGQAGAGDGPPFA